MSYLERVRTQNPLVHNITNLVVAPFTANGLLALGASPFMAHAHEEVADVAKMSAAVVLNIGTLGRVSKLAEVHLLPPFRPLLRHFPLTCPGTPAENFLAWNENSATSASFGVFRHPLDEKVIQSIRLAGQSANTNNIPVVLDPVGAGATAYRTETVQMLIRELRLTVLRGNVAEVAHVIGESWSIKGVDAGHGEGDRIGIAERAAQQLGCVVVITGREDIITNGQTTFLTSNGHALLTQVTGAGCLLSSVIGAFVAIAESGADMLDSVVEALTFYGVAAEIAAEHTAHQGPGSFQIELLNQLAQVTPNILAQRAQLRQISGGAQ